MKICFDFVCDEAILFAECAKRMALAGHDICGFSLGNRWEEGWNGKIDTFDIGCEEIFDVDVELKRISEEYADEFVSRFTQADRFISKLPRGEQRKILVSTFRRFEELAENGIDAFVTTGVAYLYNLVLLAVARKKNIPSFSLYGARQPTPRFTYSLSNGGNWDAVSRAYELLLQEGGHLDDEKEYVLSFREKAMAPDYMGSVRQAGGLKFVFIREFFVRWYRWVFDGWNKPEDYITQSPFWYARRDLKRILLKRIIPVIFDFDAPSDSDDYYIYPLHLQPEASTLVLGDDYVDQLNTIKSIAKRLPADCWLYVKEHPAAFGRHSLGFYKAIKGIHNVKLVSHNENTQKLIYGAKGVVVISGTMGWESILLGRPCIVLGSVFYAGFKGAVKVKNLQELEELLKHEGGYSATVDDAARAIKAVVQGSLPGYFDTHKVDTVGKVLAKENVDSVAFGIERILNGF